MATLSELVQHNHKHKDIYKHLIFLTSDSGKYSTCRTADRIFVWFKKNKRNFGQQKR